MIKQKRAFLNLQRGKYYNKNGNLFILDERRRSVKRKNVIKLTGKYKPIIFEKNIRRIRELNILKERSISGNFRIKGLLKKFPANFSLDFKYNLRKFEKIKIFYQFVPKIDKKFEKLPLILNEIRDFRENIEKSLVSSEIKKSKLNGKKISILPSETQNFRMKHIFKRALKKWKRADFTENEYFRFKKKNIKNFEKVPEKLAQIQNIFDVYSRSRKKLLKKRKKFFYLDKIRNNFAVLAKQRTLAGLNFHFPSGRKKYTTYLTQLVSRYKDRFLLNELYENFISENGFEPRRRNKKKKIAKRRLKFPRLKYLSNQYLYGAEAIHSIGEREIFKPTKVLKKFRKRRIKHFKQLGDNFIKQPRGLKKNIINLNNIEFFNLNLIKDTKNFGEKEKLSLRLLDQKKTFVSRLSDDNIRRNLKKFILADKSKLRAKSKSKSKSKSKIKLKVDVDRLKLGKRKKVVKNKFIFHTKWKQLPNLKSMHMNAFRGRRKTFVERELLIMQQKSRLGSEKSNENILFNYNQDWLLRNSDLMKPRKKVGFSNFEKLYFSRPHRKKHKLRFSPREKIKSSLILLNDLKRTKYFSNIPKIANKLRGISEQEILRLLRKRKLRTLMLRRERVGENISSSISYRNYYRYVKTNLKKIYEKFLRRTSTGEKIVRTLPNINDKFNKIRYRFEILSKINKNFRLMDNYLVIQQYFVNEKTKFVKKKMPFYYRWIRKNRKNLEENKYKFIEKLNPYKKKLIFNPDRKRLRNLILMRRRGKRHKITRRFKQNLLNFDFTETKKFVVQNGVLGEEIKKTSFYTQVQFHKFRRKYRKVRQSYKGMRIFFYQILRIKILSGTIVVFDIKRQFMLTNSAIFISIY